MSSSLYEFSDQEDNCPGDIASSVSRTRPDMDSFCDSSELNLEMSVSDSEPSDQDDFPQMPPWARELRHEIKRSKADTEKKIDALASRLSARNNQTHEAVHSRTEVPRHVRSSIAFAVRSSYGILLQNGLTFDFSSGGFTAESNVKIAQEISTHVMAEHEWDKGLIQGAIKVYFKSLRDRNTRARNQSATLHIKRCRRNSSMARKLKRRLAAISKIDVSPRMKVRWEEVMTKEYTSSDEEEGTELIVKSLTWETDALSDAKQQLDNYFINKMANAQQRRLIARQERRSNVKSNRICPENAPLWAKK